MPLQTITAEVDGKVMRITADVPDGASNDDVIEAVREYVAQHPAPDTTFFGGMKEAVKGAADAIPRGISTFLRPFYQPEQTVETPTTWQTPSQAATALMAFQGRASKPGEKATLPATGVDAPAIKEAYDKSAMAKYLAPADGYESSMYRQVGSVLGGAVPYLVAGGIAGPGGVAALGAAQGAGTQGEIVDEARRQGMAVPVENERIATALGAGIGALGALPMVRITNPIQGALQGAIGRGLAAQTGRTVTEAANRGVTQLLASAATQSALAGVTGGAQQLANNAVERGLINPEQAYMEGVKEAAISGAIGGGLIDATIGHLARKIEANQNAPKTTKKPLPQPKLNEHVGEHVDIGSEMYPEAQIIPREIPDDRPPFFYDAEAEAAKLPDPGVSIDQFYGTAPIEPQFNPNAWGMRTATMPGAEAPAQAKPMAPRVSARTKPVEIAAEPSQVAGFAEAIPVQNEIKALYPDATPEQLLAEAQRYAKMSPEQRKATIESRLQAQRAGAKPMYSLEEPPAALPEQAQTGNQGDVVDSPTELSSPSQQDIGSSQPNPIEWRKQAEGVGRTLRGFMDKVGAPDSMLRMVKTVEDYTSGNKQMPQAKGQYYKQGIQFAFNVADKMPERFGTVGHEVSHFFKDAGLYTPKEMDVIFKRAKADGIVEEIASNPEYQKQNLNEQQLKDEVVAHAIERYVTNEYSPNGQSRGLLNRAKNFAERLANGFKREGFVTADDVMNRFLGGEIGARDRAQGIEVPTNGNQPGINGALNRGVQADKEKPAVTEDFPTERLAKYDEVAATEGGQDNAAKPMMAMRERQPEAELSDALSSRPALSDMSKSAEAQDRTTRSGEIPSRSTGSSDLNSAPDAQPSSVAVDSQPNSATPQDRILALVDTDTAKGKRKSISAIRQESGLSPEEFDKAFLDLVRQDKIQSNRADMPTERYKQFGYGDEGDYVHDPVSGKPFLTASREDQPMYSMKNDTSFTRWKNRDELMDGVFVEPEKTKPLLRRVMNYIDGIEGWRIRKGAADSNIYAQKMDEKLSTTKARNSSYAAITNAKSSLSLLPAALQHGAPVYEEGGFRVKSDSRNKGLIPFIRKIEQDGFAEPFFHYQTALRGSYLDAEGREHLLTPDAIAKGKALGQKYPQLEKYSQEFKALNDKWIDLMVNSGNISEAAAADWKSRPYIPFFRDFGDESSVHMPSIRNVAGGVKSLKELKGGSNKLLADPVQSLIVNYAAMLDMSMKNVAANRTIRNAYLLDAAEPFKPGDKTHTDVVTHYVNGKKLRTTIHDRDAYELLTQMNLPPGKVEEFFGKFSHILRNAVTRTPTFMVNNIIRDSIETTVKGDYSLLPGISALDGVIQAAKESPSFQALQNAGITGGPIMIDPSRAAGSKIQSQLRRAVRQGKDLSYMDLVKEGWDRLGSAMEKSEAANRIKIYEDVLKRTGDKTQAEWEARDVMNFAKRGSNPIVRMLTPMVPFMNARIQGTDTVLKVLSGSGYGGGERGAAAKKAAWRRGIIMFLGSIAYAQAIRGFEFYENLTDEERRNNWFIPTDEKGKSAPVKIPAPFEIGGLFKVFPEELWRLYSGQSTKEDFGKAAAAVLLNNFSEVPIPQAIKPVFENYVNYDFFRGRQVENQQMQALMPEDRWDDYTSMAAREVGKATGMSPLKIDHAMKGYTGTMGVFALSLMDRLFRPEAQGERPADAIWQTPGIGRFFQRPDGAGKIMAYYDFDRKVDEVVNSIRRAQNSGDAEAVRRKVTENRDLLAAKSATDSIGNALKSLRKARVQVTNSTQLNSDQKREMLDRLRAKEIEVAKQLDQVKARLMK